LYIGQRRRQQQ